MRRIIELKHVRAKRHVQILLDELLDRLEEKLQHFSGEAVSVHALFEENGSHKLYRTALTCHVPGRTTVAAHEEQREAGLSIREAFKELERQLEKQKAAVRHERLLRRVKRAQRAARGLLWLGAALVLGTGIAAGEGPDASSSPKERVAEALQLIESADPYQRQLGFLRLEALRDPSAADAIRKHLESKDPDLRAYTLRALAAMQGPAAIPQLLQSLRGDRHPAVRRAALLGLEPLREHDPELIPAFIAALRDRHPEVRLTAVDIVSRIDHARAREAIFLRNKRERNRNVRRALSLAMKRLGAS
ncbi:MAG: HEAT repeat domain-containing protein [Candidatus Omnitrophica bacterium]|nr:HEAT repeat domain-containing protein [Candidatus Omnitrophota bacterium]